MHYHGLHNVVWPGQLAGSLTCGHTLPVLIDERYYVLAKRRGEIYLYELKVNSPSNAHQGKG